MSCRPVLSALWGNVCFISAQHDYPHLSDTPLSAAPSLSLFLPLSLPSLFSELISGVFQQFDTL